MMLPAGILHSEPHPLWDARRLWSLWDMIDFQLGLFLRCWQYLDYEFSNASLAPPNDVVPEAQHSRIQSNINNAVQPEVAKLFSETTRLAAVDVEDLLTRYNYKKYTYGELTSALARLRRDFRESAAHEYFFHYPRDMAKLCFSIPVEWKGAIAEFPDCLIEIQTGTDCYAMGDYPGCVFHMTRIAEMGLREVARELKVKTVKKNKPIEYAMWGEVIGALQIAVDDLRSSKGNSKALTSARRDKRDRRIERYSVILSDMQALLPLRDRNSHYRNKYDRGEGFTAMNRVKEMMNLLAVRP